MEDRLAFVARLHVLGVEQGNTGVHVEILVVLSQTHRRFQQGLVKIAATSQHMQRTAPTQLEEHIPTSVRSRVMLGIL